MTDPDEVKTRVEDSRLSSFESDIHAGAGEMIPFPTDKVKTIIPLSPRLSALADEGRVDLVTIHGHSLEGIGIVDGDQVLCKTVSSVREIKDGSVCIVRVISTNETLAKRVSRQLGKVVLKSCNPSVSPRFVDESDLEIQGVILKLVRGPDVLGRYDRGYEGDIGW